MKEMQENDEGTFLEGNDRGFGMKKRKI